MPPPTPNSEESDNHNVDKDLLIIDLRSLTISDKPHHLLSQHTSE